MVRWHLDVFNILKLLCIAAHVDVAKYEIVKCVSFTGELNPLANVEKQPTTK